MKALLCATVLVLESWLVAPVAEAQYSAVTSPFNSASSGFFEQIGVGFGFRTRNFFCDGGFHRSCADSPGSSHQLIC